MWGSRRRRRAAIDNAEIRRKFRRMAEFLEGRKAYQEAEDGAAVPCPYAFASKQGNAWCSGFNSGEDSDET